jgi:diguanylate cyclase (GGDEF)-like protein
MANSDRPYLLVVEDSPTTMAVISKHLAGHFDLVGATNGEEAWQLLQSDAKIELVITDVNMPKLSGFELLQRIRESNDKRIAGLPVFIMTTNDDESGKEQALIRGANDFVTKPINPLVLRARVNVHHKVSRISREENSVSSNNTASASKDPQTGFYTKEGLIERAEDEVTDSLGSGKPLALLLIKIENLDALEEKHGSEATDEILTTVARLLNKLIRDVDIAAHIEQDEFALVLPNTKQLGTTLVGQRVRTTIERTTVIVGATMIEIAASIGIAMIPGDQAKTISGLLEIADTRLKKAGNLGGNRICVNDQGDENFSE